MKHSIYSVSLIGILTLTAFSSQEPNDWKIIDGYAVKFETSYAEGEFTSVNGTVLFDEDNLEISKFDINLDVASISTGNSLKDNHAKKDKWFGADKYPTIQFKSSNITKTGADYKVVGNLALHGVKKEITIPFTFINNIFKGSFTLNRLDYKVGTDTGFSSIVGNDIKIELSVPVVRK
jgi:polyisoprenoid-binding protein YceI